MNQGAVQLEKFFDASKNPHFLTQKPHKQSPSAMPPSPFVGSFCFHAERSRARFGRGGHGGRNGD